MRRLLGAVAVCTVALAVTSTASGQVPTQDSVTFTGSFGGLSFEINIRSGPSGENPTGRVVVRNVTTGFLFVDGPPTCLALYPIPRPAAIRAVFQAELVGGGTASFEAFQGSGALGAGITDRALNDCSDSFFFLNTSGLGQLVIIDAAPLPTVKEQCQNGGWKTYGVFKNQGDCASFVATGGKNGPSGQ